MDAKHQMLSSALKSRTYESLLVRRLEKQCYFMIRIDGKIEVYVNEFGKVPQYRHIWQIRQWLEQRFGITGEKITLLK
jgi:hypothetical protein